MLKYNYSKLYSSQKKQKLNLQNYNILRLVELFRHDIENGREALTPLSIIGIVNLVYYIFIKKH
jgi:hypothetical protein